MKRKRKKRTEADNPSPIEIRNHANGRLDEIVARGANIHLEQMDSNYWGWDYSLPVVTFTSGSAPPKASESRLMRTRRKARERLRPRRRWIKSQAWKPSFYSLLIKRLLDSDLGKVDSEVA